MRRQEEVCDELDAVHILSRSGTLIHACISLIFGFQAYKVSHWE